jgi:hypothetical protein
MLYYIKEIVFYDQQYNMKFSQHLMNNGHAMGSMKT